MSRNLTDHRGKAYVGCPGAGHQSVQDNKVKKHILFRVVQSNEGRSDIHFIAGSKSGTVC